MAWYQGGVSLLFAMPAAAHGRIWSANRRPRKRYAVMAPQRPSWPPALQPTRTGRLRALAPWAGRLFPGSDIYPDRLPAKASSSSAMPPERTSSQGQEFRLPFATCASCATLVTRSGKRRSRSSRAAVRRGTSPCGRMPSGMGRSSRMSARRRCGASPAAARG